MSTRPLGPLSPTSARISNRAAALVEQRIARPCLAHALDGGVLEHGIERRDRLAHPAVEMRPALRVGRPFQVVVVRLPQYVEKRTSENITPFHKRAF